jgi:hypothetical protein
VNNLTSPACRSRRYRWQHEHTIASARISNCGSCARTSTVTAATQALLTKIHAILAEFRGYGYRRVPHALRHQGITNNHKKVMRVMRHAGLAIKRRARVVTTTNSNLDFPIYRNLYRNVICAAPVK